MSLLPLHCVVLDEMGSFALFNLQYVPSERNKPKLSMLEKKGKNMKVSVRTRCHECGGDHILPQTAMSFIN